MIARNLLFTIGFPFVIWLLYGTPDLSLLGNLALFAVVIVHLYLVIWSRLLFVIFSGDQFTYGFVALGVNISSFVSSLFTGFVTFHWLGKEIRTISMISPYAWGFIAVGFLVSMAIPVSSARHVSPLPKSSSRREYEDPTRGP